MKLVFLGTAQDGGVPQIGCRCANCVHVRRFAASIALVDGKEAVVIDVTPDFRLQHHIFAERFGADVNAVYLTHAHWGHYGGLMSFGGEGCNSHRLPAYHSRRFYKFLSSNEPFSSLFSSGNITANILKENVSTVHNITPVSVPHRDEFSDSFGFRIDLNGKSLFYLPCVDRLTPELVSIIRSSNISVIDGTFFDNNELPHRDMSQIPHPLVSCSVEEFSDIADRIIFTHLNHTNPLLNPRSAELKRVLKGGFRVADDWDVLE